MVVLPVASVFPAGNIFVSPIGEGEDQTGSEEDGDGFDKIDLFSDSGAALLLAPSVCILRGDDAPLERDADFLIGHFERGPPSR